MNIVKRSREMKKPKTPTLSRQNHMKNSLAPSVIFHEANVPVKTMTDESRSIATEMPSTPTSYLMLRGAYHVNPPVKSMAAIWPSARNPRYRTTRATDRASRAEAPVTMTA